MVLVTMFGSPSDGLDALLHRPQPGAFHEFCKRPCTFLACKLYAWPRRTPPPPCSSLVTIICISDTHNSQPALPDGAILIHAGDMTQSGTHKELQATLDWLQRQPHRIKIVIAGNHDRLLDANDDRPGTDAVSQRQSLNWGDITYLENSETTVTCKNGRRLHIYGSPLSPRHGGWVFQYPRSKDVWRETVPDGIDILVTHCPPRAHLDLLDLGCVHLLRELWRVRPRLHVFGHVHAGAGVENLCFDELQVAYERTVIADGGLWNLVRTVVAFVRNIFGERAGGRCILVNAAMVGGLRDNERRRAVRVVM